MALNLDSLSKSLEILKRSIEITETHSNSSDPHLKQTLKSSVIQNFEVAYE